MPQDSYGSPAHKAPLRRGLVHSFAECARAMPIYTVTYRQQPIGVARANDREAAIELVCNLHGADCELSELRTREPTKDERETFMRWIGSATTEGSVALLV